MMTRIDLSDLQIRQLSAGYWHIRGVGPCEWAQPPSWPCTDGELEAAFFPEASNDFRRTVRTALMEVRDGQN